MTDTTCIGCGCGATVKPGVDATVVLTAEQLGSDVLELPGALAQITGALLLAAGWAFNPAQICSAPKVCMPGLSELWALNPPSFVNPDALGRALQNKLYNLWCDCTPCPPVTDCGTGYCETVVPQDVPSPPVDGDDYRYFVIPSGTDVYTRSADGTCRGLSNGVMIRWQINPGLDSRLLVMRCNPDESGCTVIAMGEDNWPTEICVGGDTTPSVETTPPPPDTYGPFLPAPDCVATDICTALAPVYDRLEQVLWMLNAIINPDYGALGTVQLSIPGASDFTGTVSDAISRGFRAIAPPSYSQLDTPTVTPVSASGTVDISEVSVVVIKPTTVPAYFGQRGTEAPIWYGNARYPAPGWVLIEGDDGVLLYSGIIYPDGLVIPVTPLATRVVLELQPGVECDVYTYTRTV